MIKISDNAKKQLIKVLSSEAEASALLITVDAGGCNGLISNLEINPLKNLKNHEIIKFDNAIIASDAISLKLLENATVDYIEELAGSKFVLDVPDAGSACSCGSSFSL